MTGDDRRLFRRLPKVDKNGGRDITNFFSRAISTMLGRKVLCFLDSYGSETVGYSLHTTDLRIMHLCKNLSECSHPGLAKQSTFASTSCILVGAGVDTDGIPAFSGVSGSAGLRCLMDTAGLPGVFIVRHAKKSLFAGKANTHYRGSPRRILRAISGKRPVKSRWWNTKGLRARPFENFGKRLSMFFQQAID